MPDTERGFAYIDVMAFEAVKHVRHLPLGSNAVHRAVVP
jgi:hypothetical protein